MVREKVKIKLEGIGNLMKGIEEQNVTIEDQLTLNKLSKGKDIVNKKTDTSLVPVIIAKTNYITEGYPELNSNNYH